MEIFYRADDGTTFNNKEECREYEEHLNKMISEIHLYDKYLQEISLNDFDWEEKVRFFKCDTEESFDFLFDEFPYTIVYMKILKKLKCFSKKIDTIVI